LTPPGFARVASGAMFAPEDALRLGYLDRIVAAEQLTDAVEEEAQRLRALDMPSFAATKARINERTLEAIRTALDDEIPAVVF
jgi:enoyl-CoA hydratase